MERTFEGLVERWFDRGNNGFGFLDSGLFFSERDVVGSWCGSVAWAKIPGTPVTFSKRVSQSKKFPGQTPIVAYNVTAGFPEEPSESLETYREVSRVREWNGRFGTLVRECGNELFFHRDSITNENRIAQIQIGHFVYHGVNIRENGKWRAEPIELYNPEEQSRLQLGLPAYESTPITDEPVVETSLVLTPEFRSKSFLEIIKERKRCGS